MPFLLPTGSEVDSHTASSGHWDGPTEDKVSPSIGCSFLWVTFLLGPLGPLGCYGRAAYWLTTPERDRAEFCTNSSYPSLGKWPSLNTMLMARPRLGLVHGAEEGERRTGNCGAGHKWRKKRACGQASGSSWCLLEGTTFQIGKWYYFPNGKIKLLFRTTEHKGIASWHLQEHSMKEEGGVRPTPWTSTLGDVQVKGDVMWGHLFSSVWNRR